MRLKDAAEEWGEEEAWIQMKEDDDVAKAGNDSEEVIRQGVEEMEDGLEPEEVAEEAEEGRKIVRKKSPITVTKEDREDHEKTHTRRIEVGVSGVCGRGAEISLIRNLRVKMKVVKQEYRGSAWIISSCHVKTKRPIRIHA